MTTARAGAGQIDAAEIGFARQIVVVAVAASAIAGIGPPEPGESRPLGRRPHVERDRDRRCTRGLGTLDQTFRHFPALRGVQLKPHRRPARGDSVLDRCRGDRREDLQVVANLGRFGDGYLAVGVEGAIAAGRRDHDRTVIFCAEQLEAHVGRADINQSARA